MTVNLFADFDAMDDPYRIEGISGECLRAYHLAQDKSIPVEEREQWIKALIERTHAGDVNAEFCLGLLTRDDFSDELNAQKSELWFSSAAAQGHLYAAYHYALCLEKRGESEKAIPWYEKAADAGIFRAQHQLVVLGIRADAERDAHTMQPRANRPHPRNPAAAKCWESIQRYKHAMQTRRREYTIYDRQAWFIAHNQKEVIG